MTNKQLSSVFLLVCGFWSVPVIAGRIPTVQEQLAAYHINIDRQSLVDALRNDNSDVRFLAAMQLSESGIKDAIPNLLDALRNEPDAVIALNLALALGRLGDAAGPASLERTCHGKGDDSLKLHAVDYLIQLHSKACVDYVLDVAVTGDIPNRTRALVLVARFEDLSIPTDKRRLQLIRRALSDFQPEVRTAASAARSQIGDAGSAAADLQEAIDHEADDSVRTQMQQNKRIMLEKQLRKQ
jgi:HEAT repeat protein